MDAADVKEALALAEADSNSIFSTLNVVSKYALQYGASNKISLDAIIRLRDWVERGHITGAAATDAVFSLCRAAGLFPYLKKEKLSWRDKVAFEFFRSSADEASLVLHREQWQAFQLLLSGKSLILSAPTSFGKSVLIEAYIQQLNPRCVVVIVPTIALLDQFRRKLSRAFGDAYSIVTRNDQKPDPDENRIYVLTQERVLDREDIGEIDLLAIDEYYKLDNERERKKENNRATLLNAALRKHLFSAKQIFFLGPTVADIVMRDDLRERFTPFPSDVSTVAIDVHDYKSSAEPYKRLGVLLQQYKSDKSLIYSKSPPAAIKLVNYLSRRSALSPSREILEFSDWLGEHYHPSWSLVSALRAGYGLHHGSIPRSVTQTLVRFFNEGSLNSLICTSTLIEGVNTAAKNVFILDKKISTTNYDYFDFRNIAGRSGRMGHHFVGRIFLFNEPPPPSEFEVKAPALSDDSLIPDSLLMNLPDETLNSALLARKLALLDQSGLPHDITKRFAGYGLGGVEKVSAKIRDLLAAGDQTLLWSGYVKYKELNAVFSAAWTDLRFNKKRLSAESAAFYANRLCGAQNLRPFFDGLVRGKDELEHKDIIERGFRALQLFDYSLPKLLMDMEVLVNYHCQQMSLEQVNYSLMAQKLDNYCAHHWTKALDEYGVPLPLGKKIEFLVRNAFTLNEAVDSVRTYCKSRDGQFRLDLFERNLIEAALS